jgi:hypothetical protein
LRLLSVISLTIHRLSKLNLLYANLIHIWIAKTS